VRSIPWFERAENGSTGAGSSSREGGCFVDSFSDQSVRLPEPWATSPADLDEGERGHHRYMAGDEFDDDVSAECHGRGDRGTYLAVQTRKVGWKPIFALLEYAICGSPCAPGILEDFKATACFAVGFQRDIASVGQFRVDRRSGMELSSRLKRAVAMHSTAICEAVQFLDWYNFDVSFDSPQASCYAEAW